MILYNPTGENILNYRIEEAELDEKGKIIKVNDNTGYKTTGNTLEWSINAGERLEFPDYVATYLKSIYDFLEIEDVDLKKEEKVDEAKSISHSFHCKKCDYVGKNLKAVALHTAIKHPETLK